MSHVFVSSSSKDTHIAAAVCAALEKDGVKCWIAPRDILPGMEWGEAIVMAIKNSEAIVLIFSSNSNRSSQVKREVERAVHREVPIIVFRVENVEPHGSLEYYLSTHHWLDALSGQPEPHLQKLSANVRAFLKEREKNIPFTTQSFKLAGEKRADIPQINQSLKPEPQKEASRFQVTRSPNGAPKKEAYVPQIMQSSNGAPKREAYAPQIMQSPKVEPKKIAYVPQIEQKHPLEFRNTGPISSAKKNHRSQIASSLAIIIGVIISGVLMFMIFIVIGILFT